MIELDTQSLKEVAAALVASGAHKATKYVGEKRVVRATRRLYRHGFSRSALEIQVTVSRPNYAEREFIKRCKRAGEPVPVKKVQLRYPPKRKRR